MRDEGTATIAWAHTPSVTSDQSRSIGHELSVTNYQSRLIKGEQMANAYWIAFYKSIKNPEALAAYAKLAGPAIQAGGGKFFARGGTEKTYEQGLNQRVVVIEFESVDKAIATHDGPAYQEALKALGKDAVEREMRIVEGV